MIKYKLVCNGGHEFEGWFRGSVEYDEQAAEGHLSCPTCASTAVSKAVMAPHVATRSKRAPAPGMAASPERQREIFAALRKLRSDVEARSTYVGDRFAEEARKIHFGEAEARAVHGEASAEDVHELVDEGVPVLPLPRLPKDWN